MCRNANALTAYIQHMKDLFINKLEEFVRANIASREQLYKTRNFIEEELNNITQREGTEFEYKHLCELEFHLMGVSFHDLSQGYTPLLGYPDGSKYPDVSTFDESDWKYIQVRANTSKEPILRIHYRLLLFSEGRNKSDPHLESIVKDEIEIINSVISRSVLPKGIILNAEFEIIFHILTNRPKIKTKYYSQLKEILELFFHSHNKFWDVNEYFKGFVPECHLVINNLSKYKKLPLFSKEELHKLLLPIHENLTKDMSVTYSDSMDFFERCAYFFKDETGLVSHWANSAINAYEHNFKNYENKQMWGPRIHSLEKIISLYNLLGDKEGVANTQRRLENEKKKIQLNKFTIDYPASFVSEFTKYCNDLSNCSLEEFMNHAILTPFSTKTLNELKEQFSNMPPVDLSDIVPVQILGAGNATTTRVNGAEYKSYNVFGNNISLLSKLFGCAIVQNQNFSSEEILNFLSKGWLGVPVSSYGTTSENLIDQIAYIIHEGFSYYRSKSTIAGKDMMLIESFALKFELIFREMALNLSIPTQKSHSDSDRFKHVGDLLDDEKIKSVFREIDYDIIRYVLVDQAGRNLRHRVAHSLILSSQYSIDDFALLFICLTKLSPFSLTKNDNP